MKILVEYEYEMGYPGCFGGGPDSWAPPEPDEVVLSKITIDGETVDDDMLNRCTENEQVYEGLGVIAALWAERYFAAEGVDD